MLNEVVARALKDGKIAAREDFHLLPSCHDRAAWDAVDPEARAYYAGAAEAYIGKPVPSLPASLYMEFVRVGDRKRYETPYFERHRALFALTVCECLENSGRCPERHRRPRVGDLRGKQLGHPGAQQSFRLRAARRAHRAAGRGGSAAVHRPVLRGNRRASVAGQPSARRKAGRNFPHHSPAHVAGNRAPHPDPLSGTRRSVLDGLCERPPREQLEPVDQLERAGVRAAGGSLPRAPGRAARAHRPQSRSLPGRLRAGRRLRRGPELLQRRGRFHAGRAGAVRSGQRRRGIDL